ncbi:MAG: DNA primase [Clostridiales bacterium]|nr:DNA primase [Clostridiales bacterium]
MSRFLPEEFIEEVRGINEISDVISEYIHLEPKGKNLFGLCPFHSEKTPSFSVDPTRQIYHCFGCGQGGNVFTFIMGLEKLDFVDAVKFLADRKGIDLPSSPRWAGNEDFVERSQLLMDINREAALFYHDRLFSPEGEGALNYLRSRGLSKATIKAFGLGYAPDAWEVTKNFLTEKGFKEQDLADAGLTVDRNGRVYDRFRNRIIYPIIDHRDRVLGFGGRVMDDAIPKYMNSPESQVFKKNSILFGLNLAIKQRPIHSLIIVEGYMDVIALYQSGFYNAVASLGTALTANHAKLMRRYTPDIFIAYDGDTAGQAATVRSLDVLRGAGCNVKVIRFPNGMDPDDALRSQGTEYFSKLIQKAAPLIEFKLEHLLSEYDLDDQEQKVDYATKAANILLKVENPLERDVYIQRLNKITGFKPELLYRLITQIENRTKQQGLKRKIIGNNRHTMGIKHPSSKVSLSIKAEEDLLRLMMMGKKYATDILAMLEDLEFEDSTHVKVITIIRDLLAGGIEPNPASILNYIEDDQERSKVLDIFRLEIEYDNVDRYILDCIKELRRSQLERQGRDLKEQILRLNNAGSSDSDEYMELVEKLRATTLKTKLGRFGKEEVM